MRLVAYGNLREYWLKHPAAKPALLHWYSVIDAASWVSPRDALTSFSKAKVLNGERIRFEIEGGSFRLIASFDFRRQVAYLKFLGTHAEYDRVDAITVEQF
jgi:mRNA interferase HigB